LAKFWRSSLLLGPEAAPTWVFCQTRVFPALQVGGLLVGYSALVQVLLDTKGPLQQMPVVLLVTEPVE
jgi:hypothetical protein